MFNRLYFTDYATSLCSRNKASVLGFSSFLCEIKVRFIRMLLDLNNAAALFSVLALVLSLMHFKYVRVQSKCMHTQMFATA